MHRTVRTRTRTGTLKLPMTVKALALLFFLCLCFRMFAQLGGDAPSDGYLTGLAGDAHFVDSILRMELGNPDKKNDAGIMILGATIPFSGSISADAPAVSDSPAQSAEDGNETLPDDQNGSSTDGATPSPPTVVTKPGKTYSAIAVNNKTDYTLDTQALLKEPLGISLTAGKPAVLIIHTHSSEAYMPDGKDQYAVSDTFRTQNKSYSVIRVGDELASAYESKGIKVIHDTGVYDYPSYQGAYNRSYDAIAAYLKKYPTIKLVIDLHRDAIQAADGTVYKTLAEVGGTTCSQVMFVIGSNASGLNHPNWQENFKLALHIQDEMNSLYPSLAKPIELSQYRYNQQAAPGSMIVEVGCTGNTLDESLTAARYFADASSKVILALYKK
ncbi:stage II sporulation protein P [Oscillospiraceae bacterium WX1]